MIWIVSAIESELLSLARGLELEGESFPILDEKRGLLLAPAGIGWLNAYQGLSDLKAQSGTAGSPIAAFGPRPTQIIFIGTAGSYDPEVKIGDVVQASDVILLDGAAELGLSGYPSFDPPTFIKAKEIFPEEESYKVASLLSLTLDPNLSDIIYKNRGVSLENMEAYAIAAFSKANKIDFSGVFAVTNKVGPEGHVEWKANHKAVEIACGEKVLELFG
ncbi:MAG: hypothetical protein QNL04_09270 [SAR324 cluster bacterium]|nr:hypothetical protein [SAR324 cluster bacterium]